jgi:hypothetical protein
MGYRGVTPQSSPEAFGHTAPGQAQQYRRPGNAAEKQLKQHAPAARVDIRVRGVGLCERDIERAGRHERRYHTRVAPSFQVRHVRSPLVKFVIGAE